MSQSVFIILCALAVTLFNVNRYEAMDLEYNYFGEIALSIYEGNATKIPFCEFFAEQEDAGMVYLKHRMLYIDIFSMAVGFRHVLPDSKSVNASVVRDREWQLIAQAAVSIWNRLRYMEGMDRIFQNASWTALANIYKASTSYLSNHVLHIAKTNMFKNIETSILANATYRHLYQETKKKFALRKIYPSKVVNYTLGRIPEIAAENYNDFLRSVVYSLKLVILDNRFSRCLYDVIQKNSTYNTHLTIELNFTDPKVLQVQTVSEAILGWARTNKVDSTQIFLDEAIEYTRLTNLLDAEHMEQFTDEFFDKLDQDFRADPEFKAELEAINDDFKRKYLQKQ